MGLFLFLRKPRGAQGWDLALELLGEAQKLVASVSWSTFPTVKAAMSAANLPRQKLEADVRGHSLDVQQRTEKQVEPKSFRDTFFCTLLH